MPTTKHEFFKLRISEDENFSLDKAVEKKINDFLSQPNFVYINHSIAIITSGESVYDNMKTVSKLVLLSLVYKDLNDSEFDMKNVSKKIKALVTKEVEAGAKLPEPNIVTEIDKFVMKTAAPAGSGKKN